MSADPVERAAGDGPDGEPGDAEREALVARLAAENRRLRDEHARLRRTRHRRTAVGLAAVGVVAAVAGLAFPDARPVLFALAGTGLFAAVLTVYLAPGRFVAADVGGGAYDAHARTVEALVEELGLSDRRVYVPLPAGADPARLFGPQHADYALPAAADLEPLLVVTDDPGARGVSLHPTGGPLLRELRRSLSGPLPDEPEPLADALAEAVVEAFELADSAAPEVAAGRVTVGVAGGAFGDVDRVDHPVASLLGVGLAVGLGRPVAVETARADDDRADVLVTCRWSAEKD